MSGMGNVGVGNVWYGKCLVWEMSGMGNVWYGKCLVWEIYGMGNVGMANVDMGNV